jgi:putative AlgH/UPF0301 family transcriptional regulator
MRKYTLIGGLTLVFILAPLVYIAPFLQFHTGKLLIAADQIGDPRFDGAVVYIQTHTIFGARGFVLNKKTDAPFHWGGPLSPDTLFSLNKITNETEYLRFYPTDMDMTDLNKTYYKGYAGWGKMQLNREILKKRWIVRDFDVKYVKDLITNSEYVLLNP